MMKMPSKVGKKVVGLIMRVPKTKKMEGMVTSSGLGEATQEMKIILMKIMPGDWF